MSEKRIAVVIRCKYPNEEINCDECSFKNSCIAETEAVKKANAAYWAKWYSLEAENRKENKKIHTRESKHILSLKAAIGALK